MSVLGQRLLVLHEAFDSANLPHAFGGAIALAYCTQEPRGTRDLDVNVFVEIDRVDETLDAMPDGVRVSKQDRLAAKRQGQVRVFYEDTPVDLFFNTNEFHRKVAASIRRVPFLGSSIPVIDCLALVVFKAMFDRTRDWADIEAIVDAGSADIDAALRHLRQLLGPTDPSIDRLQDLIQD